MRLDASAVESHHPMVYEIDPLLDPRWPEFLTGTSRASVFHTRGWLQALQRTYGYKPVALTTSKPNSELTNGLVFCSVKSLFTGQRMVSLPFSDHCEPLVGFEGELVALLAALEERSRTANWKYIELRPASGSIPQNSTWGISEEFYLHRLDLRPGISATFRQLHKNCIQRKILRARKEGIEIRSGRDGELLRSFYELVLCTRRRQGLPPQPRAWFENVLGCLGDSAVIRCAYYNGKAAAAIMVLRFRQCAYYKYGASAAHLHRLGAMPYLIWDAIQDAGSAGMTEFDMGRSGTDNHGLIGFKDRWAAARTRLCYFRSPGTAIQISARRSLARQVAGAICGHLPDSCLAAIGTLAYRHIA